MPDDDDQRLRAEYLHAFKAWGTPDDLYKLMSWASPKDLEQIRHAVGSPSDAIAGIQAMKKAAARAQFRDNLRELVRTFFNWMLIIGGMGGALTVLKAFFPDAFGWWPR